MRRNRDEECDSNKPRVKKWIGGGVNMQNQPSPPPTPGVPNQSYSTSNNLFQQPQTYSNFPGTGTPMPPNMQNQQQQQQQQPNAPPYKKGGKVKAAIGRHMITDLVKPDMKRGKNINKPL